jgi:hypothetical protein
MITSSNSVTLHLRLNKIEATPVVIIFHNTSQIDEANAWLSRRKPIPH